MANYIKQFKKLHIGLFLFLLAFLFQLPAFSQAARQKDATVVAVNELSDVKGDEWAYKAVQELVEKYDVLEGYPDSTYRGKEPSTRFELAAAIYDLATYFSDEIASDREDLSKLAKLLDEFSNDLKVIQGKVDKLESRVTTVESTTKTIQGQIAKHETELLEHEKRLAYAERRKGFIVERFLKGIVVDMRDFSRGLLTAVTSPFKKETSTGNLPQ